MKRLVPALAAVLAVAPALAQQNRGSGVPAFGPSSKAPIQIDADKLEVFSKDNKAVYSGNVVAVQGETTIKSATMMIFYERRPENGDAAAANGGEGGTQLKRVEAKGGVTVVSKDQVATGDEGAFDRGSNKIFLTGNVALSQGENVTKGERLVFDTETGVAQIESSPRGGRVRGLFVTGEEEKKGARPAAKPATPPAAAPAQKPKS